MIAAGCCCCLSFVLAPRCVSGYRTTLQVAAALAAGLSAGFAAGLRARGEKSSEKSGEKPHGPRADKQCSSGGSLRRVCTEKSRRCPWVSSTAPPAHGQDRAMVRCGLEGPLFGHLASGSGWRVLLRPLATIESGRLDVRRVLGSVRKCRTMRQEGRCMYHVCLLVTCPCDAILFYGIMYRSMAYDVMAYVSKRAWPSARGSAASSPRGPRPVSQLEEPTRSYYYHYYYYYYCYDCYCYCYYRYRYICIYIYIYIYVGKAGVIGKKDVYLREEDWRVALRGWIEDLHEYAKDVWGNNRKQTSCWDHRTI